MTKDTVFKAQKQIDMADAAITVLKEEIENLNKASTSYTNLIGNSNLVSDGFSMIQEIAYDYTVAIRACITADELDIQDLLKLKSYVGTTDYDGEEIISTKDEAMAKSIADGAIIGAMKGSSINNTDLSDIDWSDIDLTDGLPKTLQYYQAEYKYESEEYEKYKGYEEAYDSIEDSTCNLFKDSVSYREIAKRGFTALSGCYDGTSFVSTYDKSWVDDFTTCESETLADYKSQWIDEDGKYDWDAIEEFLENEDADSVFSMEYLAFVELMDGMGTDDLEKLFDSDIGYLDDDEYNKHMKETGDREKSEYLDNDQLFSLYDEKDYKFKNFSPVLARAIEIYKLKAKVESYSAIYSKGTSSDDVDKANSKLAKAELLYQISEKLQTYTYFSLKKITCEDDGEKYSAILDTEYDSALGEDVEWNLEVNRSDCWTDATLDEITSDSLDDLAELTEDEDFGEYMESNVVDMFLGDFISKISESNLLSIPLTLTIDAINYKSDDEATNAIINSAKNNLKLGNAMEALSISGNIVNFNNIASVENAHFDEKDLTIKVAAYNESEGKDITVDDLKKSANDNDVEFIDYMDWYNPNDCDEYKSKLQKTLTEFISENNINTDDNTIDDLSMEQLEAIIQKEQAEDEGKNYTIDASLWN